MSNRFKEPPEKERGSLFAIRTNNFTTAGSNDGRIEIAAASHAGLVRENNEDHYLVIRFHRTLENVLTNIPEAMLEKAFDVTGYGLLVADGMGGEAGGEVASSMALAKLVELLVDTPDWILLLKRHHEVKTVLDRMTDRFLQIDESLRDQAAKDSDLLGMGTTLTVAALLGSDLIIGHVGDSRAYIMRKGQLTQATNDHTLAQCLIDAGVTKPDEPAARSTRHVLTAAVGSLGDRVFPQVRRMELCPGDQILLCTDGLTDMLPDVEIASILTEAESADTACRNLIDFALSAGGLDNVTVALARFNGGN